jgi:hypothetical protein
VGRPGSLELRSGVIARGKSRGLFGFERFSNSGELNASVSRFNESTRDSEKLSNVDSESTFVIYRTTLDLFHKTFIESQPYSGDTSPNVSIYPKEEYKNGRDN